MKTTRALLLLLASVIPAFAGSQWSKEEANKWHATQPWLVGSNFSPSSAINQLEMWQAGTFDPATIDRELGYAAGIGMNSARVFLHNMLWEQDSEGLLKRIDKFLEIAAKHKIGIMFVLFDDVWDPHPHLGQQREPRPHVHNSGWVQSPGRAVLIDEARHDTLKPYVQGIIGRYKNDPRVIVWDLYNEPGNGNNEVYRRWEPKNKTELSLKLLKKSFEWAWEIRPSQPLTAGVWTNDWSTPEKRDALNAYQIDHSDVISYHVYGDPARVEAFTKPLLDYGRPVLCTEFLARTANCHLRDSLPYFKQLKVGAFQWGLVAGKTQTNYPWESWDRAFDAEPQIWFHDLFRKDGSPFDPAETELYKKLTSGN